MKELSGSSLRRAADAIWVAALTAGLLAIAGCGSSTNKMADAAVDSRDGTPPDAADARAHGDGARKDGPTDAAATDREGPDGADAARDASSGRDAARDASLHDAADASSGRDATRDASSVRDAPSLDGGDAAGPACVIAAYNGPVPVPATPSIGCVAASASDVWTNEPLMPSSGTVTHVFALSANDAWLSKDAEVLHWDGAAWANAFVAPTSGSLGEIWASSPNDLWVGGGRLRHWDGQTLTDVLTAVIPEVHGLASNDVWSFLDNSQFLIHWDGSSWTQISPYPPGTYRIAQDRVQFVWPVSRDDVWVAGFPDRLFHWDGTSWHELSVCLQQPGNAINKMWGTSGDNIWMSTRQGIFHYDGVAWTQIDRDIAGDVIWGSCANDIWMTLADQTGKMAHFDGVKWSRVSAPRGDSVSGSGPDDVWVSTQYTVYHRHVTPPAAVCGNYRVDPGETCDPWDGAGGTCDLQCQSHAGCGDGIVQAGEECDPPEPHTCSNSCKRIPVCGNGLLDPGEQCDPPNETLGSARWCDANCQIPRCGNGVVDPGEDCDPPAPVPGNLPQQSPIYCGSDCKTHNACTDCHQQCDSSPLGFAACRPTCAAGHYLSC